MCHARQSFQGSIAATLRKTETHWRFLLNATLAALSGCLLACAALAWWWGGFDLRLGPFHASLANPLRAATQGAGVLLVREGLAGSSALRSRLRFLGLLAALIVGLTLESSPRVVGDGAEFVAMAWNLSMGRLPALTGEELRQAEELLPRRADGYGLSRPELRSADGRQEFYHFWAYSLLVAPLVRVAVGFDLPVLPAFTILNGLLLLMAAFVLLAQAGPRVTLLIFGGAILWWVDKAHSEVFILALLMIAITLLPTRPGVSLTVQGLAGLQNPLLGVTVLSSAIWLRRRGRLGETGARVGLGIALVLLSGGPAYFLWRIGHPSPLSWTILLHWPGLAELVAVLIDTNLGLLFAWPSFFLAVVVAAIGASSSRTLETHKDTVILLGVTAAVILIAVTQPANLNHGGTRGVSRYALWLVPLAVPLLVHFDRTARRARGVLLALAAGSLVTAFAEYNPRMGERYLDPTPVAQWFWRRWPGATNPLPEVFAERTAHFEGPGTVPAATAGCEKALLVGDGTPKGAWPLWCRPIDVPPACSVVGAYCYANATATGYSFAAAPRQPAFHGRTPVAFWWSGSPTSELVRLLAGIPWNALLPADPRNPGALFAARRGVGRVRARINRDLLLFWIERPRQGATVSLYPAPNRRAILIDPRRAVLLQHVALHPSLPTSLSIPDVSPLLLMIVPATSVAADLMQSGTNGDVP